MIAQIGTLVMLVILQAVLRFDNLLYISTESKRAPEKDQAYVRKLGIVLRIVLLFLLVKLLVEKARVEAKAESYAA
jgi:predicted tellurium resistance membrane protein TerC